jgi:dienelactone hydrolase
MRSAIALLAPLIAACAGLRDGPGNALTEPGPPTTGPSVVADSCAVARPDFGGRATAADRALFAYDVDAPLNLQKTVESDEERRGDQRRLVRQSGRRLGHRPAVRSRHPLEFTPRDRAHARHAGNARSMAGQGQGLAEHGAVVIAIDAPFARRGGPPIRFATTDRTEQIQLIKDLQRAVDVLRARPNVDGTRIAYLGISYGGAMGALFVGIERRIRAAVLVVGDGGLVSHSTGPEDLGMRAVLSCAARVGWLRASGAHRAGPIHRARRPPALLTAERRLDNWYRGRCAGVARAPRSQGPSSGTTRDRAQPPCPGDRHAFLNAQIASTS